MKETAITIPGPAGDLESILLEPQDQKNLQAVAIVCHPHPLYEGTMNNKVVTTVARTLQELGLPVIRFNFRGVGKSNGEYGNTKGEIEDLLAVIAWVKKKYPAAKLWLAGFSFGSFIAAKVAIQIAVEKLILIAPPVNHFDFVDLPAFTSQVFVIQGDQDEVVPAEEVYAWVDSLETKPHLIHFPEATHFFHGRLGKLHDALIKQLTTQ